MPAFIAAIQTFENFDHAVSNEHTSNGGVVRRHSLSLQNRTPPRGSLAADILETGSPRSDLLRTKSMLNDIKYMAEKLSDFGSCLSSSSSGGENSEVENSEIGDFKNLNEKKRNKKKKRKLKLTPGKGTFLKKPNLVVVC